MGYKIFILCLRQVLNNWKMALRLSWFWFLAAFLFGVVLTLFMFNSNAGMSSGSVQQGSSATSWLSFILMVAFLMVGMTAVAIGWHRYVLREEMPSSFYVLRREWPLGKYIWISFKIIIVMFLVIIALMIVLTILFGSSKMASISMVTGSIGQVKASGVSLISMLIPFVTTTIATWIFLRLGATLPAVAMGENASIRYSFRLTKAISGPLLITAVLMVLFQFIPAIVQLLMEMIIGPGTLLTTLMLPVISVVFAWFSFFVGFGVLTVIYGHLAEDKPI